MSELKKIAVLGGGTMGNGIAQICAAAGYEVSLVEVDQVALDRALGRIKDSLARFVKSGKMTQEVADSTHRSIRPVTSFADIGNEVDMVIEAVPEVLDIKKSVFEMLSRETQPGTILATNTSQLSITNIASAASRPEDVIGVHFFNPPVLMRLVEVIRGVKTSDRALETVLGLVTRLGKEAAVCKRDTVGFITTRAATALRLECLRMYEEGVASIEDIDRAMRLGFNHPMGPFELNDYNGLDVAYNGAKSLREAYGERFAPPQSLTARVAAGMLGRKTGQGWYDHSGEKPVPIN
ncbi:3-hydroxyacyl-CoA dehydrogenase family protein [Chelativorans sp. AA-79]|uniref:3-hydroxyacyl-CoA dehydrogenase family protein n=1 Tax=Chelativorans sp. AA-79 TaxID=3028735 RepID=UPI0023F6FE16|nr:3-hydroxyacyl-CoA dehydrogenase family protein [Chelativorans sp. AA-79]WEX12455.1 3-hydroxyacyl-CoA dehydrogenase family protein [Chelativorans sp. AA-79]